MTKSNERYFSEVYVQYFESLHERYNNLTFLLEIKKIGKSRNLELTCKMRRNILYT